MDTADDITAVLNELNTHIHPTPTAAEMTRWSKATRVQVSELNSEQRVWSDTTQTSTLGWHQVALVYPDLIKEKFHLITCTPTSPDTVPALSYYRDDNVALANAAWSRALAAISTPTHPEEFNPAAHIREAESLINDECLLEHGYEVCDCSSC